MSLNSLVVETLKNWKLDHFLIRILRGLLLHAVFYNSSLLLLFFPLQKLKLSSFWVMCFLFLALLCAVEFRHIYLSLSLV